MVILLRWCSTGLSPTASVPLYLLLIVTFSHTVWHNRVRLLQKKEVYQQEYGVYQIDKFTPVELRTKREHT